MVWPMRRLPQKAQIWTPFVAFGLTYKNFQLAEGELFRHPGISKTITYCKLGILIGMGHSSDENKFIDELKEIATPKQLAILTRFLDSPTDALVVGMPKAEEYNDIVDKVVAFNDSLDDYIILN